MNSSVEAKPSYSPLSKEEAGRVAFGLIIKGVKGLEKSERFKDALLETYRQSYTQETSPPFRNKDPFLDGVWVNGLNGEKYKVIYHHQKGWYDYSSRSYDTGGNSMTLEIERSGPKEEDIESVFVRCSFHMIEKEQRFGHSHIEGKEGESRFDNVDGNPKAEFLGSAIYANRLIDRFLASISS